MQILHISLIVPENYAKFAKSTPMASGLQESTVNHKNSAPSTLPPGEHHKFHMFHTQQTRKVTRFTHFLHIIYRYTHTFLHKLSDPLELVQLGWHLLYYFQFQRPPAFLRLLLACHTRKSQSDLPLYNKTLSILILTALIDLYLLGLSRNQLFLFLLGPFWSALYEN